MESVEGLPDARIDPSGPCSRTCRERGIDSFQQLGRVLRDLRYGRPADRSDWSSVLTAGRGTCSTKHAFLAATAEEQTLPIQLTLGLYEMTEANTHGVGGALIEAGVEAVPEAHCYLRYRDNRIDITRSASQPGQTIVFLDEETIRPDQIGDYKVDWHQRHLRAWCETHAIEDWRQIWEVRERCIQLLSTLG